MHSPEKTREVNLFHKCKALYSMGLLYRRHSLKISRWKKEYLQYRSGKIKEAPLPAILQVIPAEHCNLRCPMCNQWGEQGYFREGRREAAHMPFEKFAKTLDHFQKINPGFLLSLHGGEPFAYRHIDQLLDYLVANPLDVMISTNGTLLDRHLPRLAEINSRTVYLVSIDGDEKTNDGIRGEGTTSKIINSLSKLTQECLSRKKGIPHIIINYCLSEYNTHCVESVVSLARKLNAMALNYNFRWFLTEEAGEAYDATLREQFQVKPTGAWRGWLAPKPVQGIDSALKKIYRMRHQKWFPLVTLLPSGLSFSQAIEFYKNYDETFGITSCIMPSFQTRIHSNGDMVFCPGHPDIIPGNVFSDDFETVYHGALAGKLRKKVEEELLPICNRCCGIYMNHRAAEKLGAGYSVHRSSV